MKEQTVKQQGSVKKRGSIAAVLVMAVSALALSASEARAAGDGGILWTTSYKAAQQQARASGKPIMVDVYTDWCGWCKVLDQKTYSDSRVIALSKGFVPVKANAEDKGEGTDLAKKYQIDGYPTILFLDASGTVLKKIDGYVDADQFKQVMESVPGKGTVRRRSTHSRRRRRTHR